MRRGGNERGRVSVKKVYKPSKSVRKFWLNKKYVMDDFYRWANIIAMVLLIYTLLLLISTSKIMERAGEIEQDSSVYGPYFTGDMVTQDHEGTVAIEVYRNETPVNGTYNSRPGGGSNVAVITNMGIEPSMFDIQMMLGEKAVKRVVIKNIGDRTLDLTASSNIENYVKILEPFSIKLAPSDSKAFNVEFDAKQLGINVGYITIKGVGLVAYVPIIFQVSSEAILGEMRLTIPDEFRMIRSGDALMLNVELSGFEKGIVDLIYIVKDVENKEVMRTTQKTTIKDYMEFDKTILLPEGLEDGLYVLAVELKYRGLSLVKSEIISIGDSGKVPITEKTSSDKMFMMTKTTFQLIILSVLGLIVLTFIVYNRENNKIKQLGLEARGIFKKKR
jgi:hypothetical protein